MPCSELSLRARWSPFLYSERATTSDKVTLSETVYCGSFFTLTKERIDASFLGKRPKGLRGGRALTRRHVRSLEVFRERQERSPLVIARELRERLEQSRAKSVRQFCRDTNENGSVLSRHLRLLRLPDDIIDFFDKNQTPEALRHFTVKRLDALTRLSDAEAISSFMQEVDEVTPCEIRTLA